MPRTHFFGPYLHSHASIIFQVIKNFRYRLAYVQSGSSRSIHPSESYAAEDSPCSRRVSRTYRMGEMGDKSSSCVWFHPVSSYLFKTVQTSLHFRIAGRGASTAPQTARARNCVIKLPDFYETIHSGIKIRCNLKFAFNSSFATTLAMPCHLSRSSKFHKFTARGGGLSSISMTLFHHFFAPTRTPCCSSLKS